MTVSKVIGHFKGIKHIKMNVPINTLMLLKLYCFDNEIARREVLEIKVERLMQ